MLAGAVGARLAAQHPREGHVNPIGRVFIQLHNTLYRATGGRKFNMGGSILLLHTIGTKSGKPSCNPLMHIKEGQDFIVIASAAGADKGRPRTVDSRPAARPSRSSWVKSSSRAKSGTLLQ